MQAVHAHSKPLLFELPMPPLATAACCCTSLLVLAGLHPLNSMLPLHFT